MDTAHATVSGETAPTDYKAALTAALTEACAALAPAASQSPEIERPRDRAHGDFSTGFAMRIAKELGRPPREVAESLIKHLPPLAFVESTEIAGPGFINVHTRQSAKAGVVSEVLATGGRYGSAPAQSGRTLVEFVSANPTGPLHIGHARNAATGACLMDILRFRGHDVDSEYYLNDTGRQADVLAASLWLRYLERLGAREGAPPDGMYLGAYLSDVAGELEAAHGERFRRECAPTYADPDAAVADARDRLGDEDWPVVRDFAIESILAGIRADLGDFGVHIENWRREGDLHDSGEVESNIAALDAAGHIYQEDGAKWFRSTTFGDDKDRVLVRGNGAHTYFAADAAYHAGKVARGYDRMIDVWGLDHHGYEPRLQAAVTAGGEARLDILFVQLVSLRRAGVKIDMSTRTGEFVTLRELINEIGVDAARFFLVSRKSDQHLEFDLELAKSRSMENPVYYVQYAHARICSVLDQWGGDVPTLVNADLGALSHASEDALITELMWFPDAVARAAAELAPHLVSVHLVELAAKFHAYYNAVPFLSADEPERTARVALAAATKTVLAGGLRLLGVSAPESM